MILSKYLTLCFASVCLSVKKNTCIFKKKRRKQVRSILYLGQNSHLNCNNITAVVMGFKFLFANEIQWKKIISDV